MGRKYKRGKGQLIHEADCGELVDKMVFVNRVAKVVKGGRRFSFSALAVTGDGRGHVGCGLGKANQVPDAIRKAGESARKNIVRVPLVGTTIPFEVIGRFGSAKVILKPASPGTGVIAGSVARSVLERVGVTDILSKCLGSKNPHNVMGAVFDALMQLQPPETVASRRGKSIEDLDYRVFGN